MVELTEVQRRNLAQENECLLWLWSNNMKIPDHKKVIKKNKALIALLSKQDIRNWSTILPASDWADREKGEYSTLRSRSTSYTNTVLEYSERERERERRWKKCQ